MAVNQSATLFSRLLKSNLLILVIPLVISLVLAQMSLTILENEARKSNLATLEQTSSIIDSRFQELDSLVKQISLDTKVKAFLGLRTFDDTNQLLVDVWALTKSLPNFPLTNSFIDRFFIYSSNLEIAVSNEEALINGPQDFARVFQYGSWNFDSWNRFFLKTPHQKRFVPQAALRVRTNLIRGLYYLQSLPLEYRQSEPLGQVIFFIREESINEYLKRLEVGESGIVLVTDGNGEIVSSITRSWSEERQKRLAAELKGGVSSDQERDGFIVSKFVSAATGWSYISVLPQDLVLAPVLFVRNLVIGSILFALLLSLTVTWVLSRRSAKPMEQAILNLQETLHQQVPVMQADLLRRLFAGLLIDGPEIEARARAAKLDLKAHTFLAAIIKIKGWDQSLPTKSLEEVNLAKAFLRERLGGLRRLRVHFQDDEWDTLSLLFLTQNRTPQELAEQARESLRLVSELLQEELHTTIQWGLGEPVGEVGQIGRSHQEAKAPFQTTGTATRFFYPMETEVRLMAYVNKGDRSGIARTLDLIKRENLVDRDLSPALFDALTATMHASLLRALPPEALTSLDSSPDSSDGKQWFIWFHQQLLQICAVLEQAKIGTVAGRIKEINHYLMANLADPSLTLFSVAKKFSMTEAFFYHFYRNHSGVSFADALERFRIERACRLLKDERLMVSQVVAKTGFTSPSTFRRAFRRVTGVAPSDYPPQ